MDLVQLQGQIPLSSYKICLMKGNHLVVFGTVIISINSGADWCILNFWLKGNANWLHYRSSCQKYWDLIKSLIHERFISIEKLENFLKILVKNHLQLEVLNDYTQDCICGTWELFARVVNDKEMQDILASKRRSTRLLEAKVQWAKRVTPLMDIEQNLSPSFIVFRDGVRRLAGIQVVSG